jgi:hypothetical protein
VSTQGSPYGRFHGALDRGNTLAALSAAAELDHVGLVDALELRLLARDGPGGDFGSRACDTSVRRRAPGLSASATSPGSHGGEHAAIDLPCWEP